MQDTSIVQPRSDAPIELPTRKVGKLQASWQMTKQTFHLMMLDKEILAFPILSAIVSLVLVGLMLAAIFALAMGGQVDFDALDRTLSEQGGQVVVYGMTFLTYLISAFVMTYFQAGLTAIVHARLQGKDIGLRDGLRVANMHIGKIFMWSLISATVGVVLRIISERSRVVGKIVAGLLGAAWGIITMFIVPTLILEPGTVRDAIRRSAETFKNAWGETLLTNISIGLIMMLFGLLGVAGMVLAITTGDISIILGAAIVTVIYFICLSIVSQSLSAVFRVVLYTYAKTGTVPTGFDPQLVAGALRKA
jgi:membrane-anchored glycerophosphoryl diester phosphodiesterase (GDPDase)